VASQKSGLVPVGGGRSTVFVRGLMANHLSSIILIIVMPYDARKPPDRPQSAWPRPRPLWLIFALLKRGLTIQDAYARLLYPQQ
jgi:hypothetical protein